MDKKIAQEMVGKNIRLHRIASHLSLEVLAEMLGITPGYLGLMERGKRGISVRYLYKLSEIFNVPIETFFSQDEGEEAKNKATNDLLKAQINKRVELMNERELHFIYNIILSFNELRNPDED